jgi:galactokinase
VLTNHPKEATEQFDQGVLESLFAQSGEETPNGFDALISSSIPSGAGVSSSAALIVASTLAALTANDKLGSVTRGDLVQMSVGNEKKVGVNSGG